VETGSPAGEALLRGLPARPAGAADVDASQAVTAQAIEHMGRRMDTDGLAALLQRNLEHPRWDDVADRCLSCGNCTMACPTCFCSDDVEAQPADGDSSARVRQWASCFSHDFSYIHGGTVRNTVRSRYRQWMTHKLGTWWEQFGTSGCVGCGRCITWCPVGIDITEEAAAIRATDGRRTDTTR
jgi:ferredoxin